MNDLDEAKYTIHLTDMPALHEFAAHGGRFLIRAMRRVPDSESFKQRVIDLWLRCSNMVDDPQQLFAFCAGILFALEDLIGILGEGDVEVRRALDGIARSPGATLTLAIIEWMNLMGMMGEPVDPDQFRRVDLAP